MATRFINVEKVADKLVNPASFQGASLNGFVVTTEKLAGDTDGTKLFIAVLKSTMIIKELLYLGESLTGMTSVDIGFYTTKLVEVDDDILAAAVDLNAGAARGSEVNLLSNVSLADVEKPIWELLGKTIDNREESYVLALTFNTGGTATGTMSFLGEIIQG